VAAGRRGAARRWTISAWSGRATSAEPRVDRKKLRAIVEVIEDVPPLPPVSLDFADWVANYTLSSPGMVLRMMMSAGRAFSPPAPRYGVRLIGPLPERMTPARARVLGRGNGDLGKSALAEAAGQRRRDRRAVIRHADHRGLPPGRRRSST
jgi:primosomal protein N' (replication factor Y)